MIKPPRAFFARRERATTRILGGPQGLRSSHPWPARNDGGRRP